MAVTETHRLTAALPTGTYFVLVVVFNRVILIYVGSFVLFTPSHCTCMFVTPHSDSHTQTTRDAPKDTLHYFNSDSQSVELAYLSLSVLL